MKKKILAMLLIGVVLGCCACGSNKESVTTSETTEETAEAVEETETTVSDNDAEEEGTSTTEESVETAETEEATEENVIKLASDYLDNCDYLYVKTTESLNDGGEEIVEYTLNRKTGVAAGYVYDTVMYRDVTSKITYMPGSTDTEWYKMYSEYPDEDPGLSEYTSMILHPYEEIFDTFNIEELTDENGTEYYYATNEVLDDTNTRYRVAVKIDKSSNMVSNVTVYKIGDEVATVETDEAVITGEDLITKTISYDILYFNEADENFNDFVSITTLPADENCISIDSEGNVITQ